MLDSSKNVLNVSKYTFPGILALTHCLWQQKPETSTGHISLPSFETEHYSDPFKKRNVSSKTTSNWFMIAVCSVQSPLWCRSLCFESSRCPAELSHNARLRGLDVRFSRNGLWMSSVFSCLSPVYSDVSRRARTCSHPPSRRRPPQPQLK